MIYQYAPVRSQLVYYYIQQLVRVRCLIKLILHGYIFFIEIVSHFQFIFNTFKGSIRFTYCYDGSKVLQPL